jgi:hypothetical protein
MKSAILVIACFLVTTFMVAQGTENFANFPETGNSYQDGTFTGQDGSTWTYWQCRGDQIITDETPCLGKDRTPTAEITSGTISNGCGILSFDFMQAFSTDVELDVFVNGLLITTVTSSSQQGIVLNTGNITVNTSGDFTLDFKQHDNGSGQVAIDNVTWTAYGSGPLPEPTNYPTDFLATPAPFSITLTWTDATGTQVPTAYLIKASDADNITLPVDGTPVVDDPDLFDGTGAINVIQGVQTYTFTNLPGNTPYYFKIFPYTNTGSNIDYKTDGTPPAQMATTPNIVILNEEDFNSYSLGTWSAQNIIGANQFWLIDSIHGVAGSACAKMSGYDGGSHQNEDWLISPALDFDTYINETLVFETASNYSGLELEVLISNEYDGVGDPNDYEWEDLTAILSPGGWSWTNSGNIDVSSMAGTEVYIGFKYTSTDSESMTWEVDDILITGEVYVGQPESSPELSMHLYPNPVRNQVQLRFADRSQKVVSVHSLLGTNLLQMTTDQQQLTLSLDHLKQGIYLVKVTNEQGQNTIQKLIKQ